MFKLKAIIYCVLMISSHSNDTGQNVKKDIRHSKEHNCLLNYSLYFFE